MNFSFIAIGGKIVTVINGMHIIYRQTTLDEFPGLKWMNPYVTIHGGTQYGNTCN